MELINDLWMKNGGPAFPTTDGQDRHYRGASLRDYFAAKALQSIYYSACADYNKNGWPEDWRMGLAVDAYDMADAMLAAREAK